MSDRPEWVPLLWDRLPFWSYIAATPRRVLIRHGTSVVWTIPLIVFGVISGSTFLLVCLLGAVVGVSIQSGIYIHLAWKAV